MAAPDGRIYVSWRQVVGDNFRHIVVASSQDNGANFGAPTIVSDDRWQISGCPVSGANLALGENNSLKIVWFTAGDNGAPGFYQSESTDGAKTFEPRKLFVENAIPAAPAFVSGKLIWSEKGKLYLTDEASKTTEIGAGEQPSAAAISGKIFVVSVKRENERRGVWLSVVNR